MNSSDMMDESTAESELYRLVQEFKSKPALVIAKVYLISKTDETYVPQLLELLIDQLELLSECDVSTKVTFLDFYELVNSIQRTHDNIRVKISRILYSIRTNSDLIKDDIDDILSNQMLESPTPRFLICHAFCSFIMKDVLSLYTALVSAFKSSCILQTRSVFYSFDLDHVEMLKEALIEGRKDGMLNCTCAKHIGHYNMSFVQSTNSLASIPESINLSTTTTTNHVMMTSANIEETSFTVDVISPPSPLKTLQSIDHLHLIDKLETFSTLQLCQLHRVVSELDEIIDKLKACVYDATPIYLAHKNARRFAVARNFYIKNKLRIDSKDKCQDIT